MVDPTPKQVDVCGYPLTIFGYDSDPYFASIETHMPANGFLGGVMKHHLGAGSVMLDVGANIGVTTAMANAIVPDVRVMAFEPSPKAFACLTATVKANGARAQTTRCCVGETDGETAFFEMDFLAGSHMIAADHPTIHDSPANIPVVSLDSWVEREGLERVDLVKIDVEGFESDVLKGMTALNARFGPLVFMEFNTFTITAYRNMSPRALLEQIRETCDTVYYEDAGRLMKAQDDGGFLALLHKAMTTGGVVDLLFTTSPERRAALDGHLGQTAPRLSLQPAPPQPKPKSWPRRLLGPLARRVLAVARKIEEQR